MTRSGEADIGKEDLDGTSSNKEEKGCSEGRGEVQILCLVTDGVFEIPVCVLLF